MAHPFYLSSATAGQREAAASSHSLPQPHPPPFRRSPRPQQSLSHSAAVYAPPFIQFGAQPMSYAPNPPSPPHPSQPPPQPSAAGSSFSSAQSPFHHPPYAPVPAAASAAAPLSASSLPRSPFLPPPSSSSPPPPAATSLPGPSSTGLSAAALAQLASLDIDRMSSQELDVLSAILAKGQKLHMAASQPAPAAAPLHSPAMALAPPHSAHAAAAALSSQHGSAQRQQQPLDVAELRAERQRLEALQAEQHRVLSLQRQLQQQQQHQHTQLQAHHQQQQHIQQQQRQHQQQAQHLGQPPPHVQPSQQHQHEQQQQQPPFSAPLRFSSSPPLVRNNSGDSRRPNGIQHSASPTALPVSPAPSNPPTSSSQPASSSSFPSSSSSVLDGGGRQRLLRAILAPPPDVATELYYSCLSASLCCRRLLQLLHDSASPDVYDAQLVAWTFIQHVDSEVVEATRAAAAGGPPAAIEHPLLIPVRLHVAEVVKAHLLPQQYSNRLQQVPPPAVKDEQFSFRAPTAAEQMESIQDFMRLCAQSAEQSASHTLHQQQPATSAASANARLALPDLPLPTSSTLSMRTSISPVRPLEPRRRSSMSHLFPSQSLAGMEPRPAYRLHSDSSLPVSLPSRLSLVRSGGSSGSLDAMTMPPPLSAESSAASSTYPPLLPSSASRYDSDSPQTMAVSTPPQLPVALSIGHKRASFELTPSQSSASNKSTSQLLMHSGTSSSSSSPTFDEPHSVFPSSYPLIDSWHDNTMDAMHHARPYGDNPPRDPKRGKHSPSINTTDNSSLSPSPRSTTAQSTTSSSTTTTTQSLTSALAQSLSTTRLGSSPPVFSSSVPGDPSTLSSFTSGPSMSTFIPIQTPVPNVQPGTLTASTKQRMRSISFSAPSPPLEQRRLDANGEDAEDRYWLLQGMQQRQRQQQKQREEQQLHKQQAALRKMASEWQTEPAALADVPTFSSSAASTTALSTATCSTFIFATPQSTSSSSSDYTAFFSASSATPSTPAMPTHPSSLDDVSRQYHAPQLAQYTQEGAPLPQPYPYSRSPTSDPSPSQPYGSTASPPYERQRKKRRKSGELAEHEKWHCPNYGCDKFYRRTSTNSIKQHQEACDRRRVGAGGAAAVAGMAGVGVGMAGVLLPRAVVLEERDDEGEEEDSDASGGGGGGGVAGGGGVLVGLANVVEQKVPDRQGGGRA